MAQETNERYELLMEQLEQIAEKTKLFPDNLRESVYKLLISTLLDQEFRENDTPETGHGQEIPAPALADNIGQETRNYVTELAKYYTEYNIAEYNDMEAAAFVAYYFTILAPPHKKVEVINEDHFIDMCKITGRKLPKRPKTTLNNAKNRRSLLESRGKGEYTLTALGEHFVKHTLFFKEGE